MGVDYVGIAYSLALSAGGLLGYAKKGSVVSAVMGMATGGLAGYGAYRISLNPVDSSVSLAISTLMTALMGFRFYNSGKMMPAGVITVLSLAVVIRSGYLMSTSRAKIT